MIGLELPYLDKYYVLSITNYKKQGNYKIILLT